MVLLVAGEVAQLHLDLDGRGIGGVPGLALLHVVLGLFIHREVHKGQLQVACVVHNGAHVLKHIPQAGVQEPPVRGLLHLQQVGHLQDLFILGEAFALGLAIHYVLDDHAEISTRFLLISRLVLIFFWVLGGISLILPSFCTIRPDGPGARTPGCVFCFPPSCLAFFPSAWYTVEDKSWGSYTLLMYIKAFYCTIFGIGCQVLFQFFCIPPDRPRFSLKSCPDLSKKIPFPFF